MKKFLDRNLDKLQVTKNPLPIRLGGSHSNTISPTLHGVREPMKNSKERKINEHDYFKAVGKNRTRIRTRQQRDGFDKI